MQSPGFDGSPRQPGIFNSAAYGRLDSIALGAGNDSPTHDTFAASSQGVSKMFDELTDQDGDERGAKDKKTVFPIKAVDK